MMNIIKVNTKTRKEIVHLCYLVSKIIDVYASNRFIIEIQSIHGAGKSLIADAILYGLMHKEGNFSVPELDRMSLEESPSQASYESVADVFNIQGRQVFVDFIRYVFDLEELSGNKLHLVLLSRQLCRENKFDILFKMHPINSLKNTFDWERDITVYFNNKMFSSDRIEALKEEVSKSLDLSTSSPVFVP